MPSALYTSLVSAWHTVVLYWDTGISTKAAQLQHPDSMVGALQQSCGIQSTKIPSGLGKRHHFLSPSRTAWGDLLSPCTVSSYTKGGPLHDYQEPATLQHTSFPHSCFYISTLLLMYSPFLSVIEHMQLEEGRAQSRKKMDGGKLRGRGREIYCLL